MEILITAGGTEEPIDGVRTISNFSTGRTGATLADSFYNAGFKVTLLTSIRAILPQEDIKTITYQSFNDLNSAIKELLENGQFSGVIHAAAVSDFSVDYLDSDGDKFRPDPDLKIDSSKPLSIMLKPNIKILNKIKAYSRNPLVVVGFKLTKNGSDALIKDKVTSLFNGGVVDYVIHNDLKNIDKDKHLSTCYKDNKVFQTCSTKLEMAETLIGIFKTGR